MKIRSVGYNNRKKVFEVRAAARTLVFPFSKAVPAPAARDPLERLFVDSEAGREAFTYVLRSGRTGTVHLEQVLEYNRDPAYLRDLLLYRLTLEARERGSADADAPAPLPGRPDASSRSVFAPSLVRPLAVREKRPKYLAKAGRPRSS